MLRVSTAQQHFVFNSLELREKIGHPMSEIHGPVPGYRKQINAPVNQFMRRLRPEKPMWRVNWSLMRMLHFSAGAMDQWKRIPSYSGERWGEVFYE